MTTATGGENTSLILSILATQPRRGAASLEARQAIKRAATSLSGMLADTQFPATWFHADPAAAYQREFAPAAELGHDLGILADEGWSSAKTSRARLAAELTHRVLAAQSAEVEIAALAMPGEVLEHADLVHRQGITAVACFSTIPGKGLPHRLHSPFYGLWQTPIETMLPHSGLRRLRMAARHWLTAASGSQPIMHAGIDLALLDQGGAAAQRSLRRWLSAVVRLRENRRCQVISLREAIAGVTPRRQTAPSRSILRAA